MSRKDLIEYPSAMQAAFVRAASSKLAADLQPTPVVKRVARVAERVKLHREPAVNTKLSYRTAQKLISQGVIE